MSTTGWRLDASYGELVIRTGVTGRAARMGHRLTMAMKRWHATVSWSGSEPIAVQLIVEARSLAVLRGEGGVKALSNREKSLVRSNALRALDAGRFPNICFAADRIERTADGYRLNGTLQIRGTTRDRVVDLRVEDWGDCWRLSTQATVRQTDFGVKPYTLLMGSLKVVDDVTVSFTAHRDKPR